MTERHRSARSDDEVARLFDEHAEAVFRLAFALLRDAHAAQDVVQETFVVAWRKRHAIRLVDGSALPWLLTTARLIALAERRRTARRRTDAVPTEDLADIAVVADEASLIAEALSVLAPNDRRLVELVLVDGLSYGEAAERLSLSVAATGKRLQRARTRLRSALTERTSP